MMRRFHEIRQREEGQALVLAAVSMLVLVLCVLATVNLTYTVSHKIQMQNAVDAAAYNGAAYQARAMNFFAYTNRAMVSRYCAQMNIMAMTTYFAFVYVFITGLLMLLSLIPGAAAVTNAIQQVLDWAMKGIDWAAAIFVPVIDALNFASSAIQEAVKWAMITRVANVQVEVNNASAGSGTNYQIDDLVKVISGVEATSNWLQTVTTGILPSLFPQQAAEAKFNRMLMVEITNSARHPWTAYGGKNGSLIPGLLRHGKLGPFLGVSFGKIARTEWGIYDVKPPSNIFAGISSFLRDTPEQHWSNDRLFFEFKPAGKLFFRFRFDSWMRADRAMGDRTYHDQVTSTDWCKGLGFFERLACKFAQKVFPGPLIDAAAKAMLAAPIAKVKANLNPSNPAHIHVGQMPYARFRMGRGSAWARPKGTQHFNQPTVMMMATLPTADLVRGGAPFMDSFSAKIGNLDGSNSALQNWQGDSGVMGGGSGGRRGDLAAPRRGWRSGTDFKPANTSIGVGGASFMKEGLHAFSAAMAYYHRPGDWHEPPNLFNPMWGAKLMPVNDHPMLGNGLVGNAVLGSLFNDLMVH